MRRAGIAIPLSLVISGLLLSGCGSGNSAAPVRLTTETVGIGRYTQIFDDSLLADDAQASVVEGFRTGLVLWDKSQENQALVSPVTTYVTGSALHNLETSLTTEKAQQIVIAGTDRLFDTRVVAISSTTATITTCDDGSKFEEVNPGTGVPDPAYSATADNEYIFETWQMVSHGGHWAISVVSPVTLPDSRAKPCQPAA